MPDPQTPLLIVEDCQGTYTYTLTEPVCTVGRSRENTIQIVGEFVSRRHAYLRRVEGGFELVDGETGGNTPSTNGIYVNKQRVISHSLRSGDLINFGPDVKATFLIPSAETVIPAPGSQATTLILNSPEDLISVDTGAETLYQGIPTLDWHLSDYYPEDLIELIDLGHFDNPLSAQGLKTAIFEQCQITWGEIEPEWQPVLDRLEALRRSQRA